MDKHTDPTKNHEWNHVLSKGKQLLLLMRIACFRFNRSYRTPLLTYAVFRSFQYECTRWKVFKKRVVPLLTYAVFRSFQYECTRWKVFKKRVVPLLTYAVFRSFQYECTRWKVFKKRVVCIEINIYDYIIFIIWFDLVSIRDTNTHEKRYPL